MRGKLVVEPGSGTRVLGVLCCLLFLVAFGLFSRWAEASSGSASAESVQAREEARQLGMLLDQVRREGRARLLVELRIVFRPEAELESPRAVLEQRERIGVARRRVLERLWRGVEFDRSAVKPFDTIPFFSVVVDEAGFWLLVRDHEVASLREDALSTPSGSAGTSGAP